MLEEPDASLKSVLIEFPERGERRDGWLCVFRQNLDASRARSPTNSGSIRVRFPNGCSSRPRVQKYARVGRMVNQQRRSTYVRNTHNPAMTHSVVSLVSVPRASTLPVNLSPLIRLGRRSARMLAVNTYGGRHLQTSAFVKRSTKQRCACTHISTHTHTSVRPQEVVDRSLFRIGKQFGLVLLVVWR